jgi:hypothetical protein
MFKLIGWILKATFFTAVVLVAAHYVTWDGKTVSDQVRSTLSSADRSVPVKTLRRQSKALLRDAKAAASHVGIKHSTSARESATEKQGETIPSADRERLQALIHSSDEG